ncbi:MAG: sulfite exporter TauE/SafE family protein [Oscillospiraceae bacterium]|nr:sulfite exporter TauE/SafE family protein [Oscillospiraceae bacterium]
MKKEQKKQNVLSALGGALVGILNGMLGAGGGMLVVPMLKKLGLEQTKAHATAVAVIFPLSILSSIAYLLLGHFELGQASFYLLPGAIGALLGALLLAKIPAPWLRKIFACFMIWAGIRMVMK